MVSHRECWFLKLNDLMSRNCCQIINKVLEYHKQFEPQQYWFASVVSFYWWYNACGLRLVLITENVSRSPPRRDHEFKLPSKSDTASRTIAKCKWNYLEYMQLAMRESNKPHTHTATQIFQEQIIQFVNKWSNLFVYYQIKDDLCVRSSSMCV